MIPLILGVLLILVEGFALEPVIGLWKLVVVLPTAVATLWLTWEGLP